MATTIYDTLNGSVLATLPTVNFTTGKNETSDFQGVGKGPLYIALIIIIAAENSLVIGAAYMRKQKGIPDILIIALAFSAILNAMVVVSIMAYVILVLRSPIGTTKFTCNIQYLVSITCRQFDILTISLISIDRYLAICKPLLYRTRAKVRHGVIAVVLSFIFGALVAALPFLGLGRVDRHLKTLCTMNWGSSSAILIVVIAYVQFAIVLFCYISIFKTIVNLVHRQKEIEKSQKPTYVKMKRKRSLFTLRRGAKVEENVEPPSPTTSIRSTHTVQSFVFPPAVETKGSFSEPKSGHDRTASGTVATFNNDGKVSPLSGLSPQVARLRRITEERSWMHHGNALSFDSEDKSDSENELPVALRTVVEHDLSAGGHDRKHSDDCGDFDTCETGARYHGRKSSLEDTTMMISCNNRAPLKRKTEQRSSSLPNILSNEDISKETAFGKPGKYTCTRLSAPHVKPNITKQLSSLRDRWKKAIVKRSSSQVKRSWKESRHFANIMGIVVLIFYITWLPLAMHITLWLVLGPTPAVFKLGQYAMNMTLSSPLLIPIIYGLMCKPYRKNYKRILWKLFLVKYFTKRCLKKDSVKVTEESMNSSKF